jgi:hypothetical protein
MNDRKVIETEIGSPAETPAGHSQHGDCLKEEALGASG